MTGEERQPGSPTLHGVAGGDAAAAALRDALSAAAPGAAVNWGVATASGPYCPVLDLIRPYAGAFGAGGRLIGLALKDNKTDLLKGDFMQPVVTMPDYAVHLQLDYFASDGTVTHLRDAKAGQTYPASAVQPMGPLQSPGTPGWEVDAPFGTDLVVALASTVPLFRASRPEAEARDAYLRDLRAALADATGRSHARISATVLMVTAAPGP